MVKAIKVIHLAPGGIRFNHSGPGPTPPCQATASCPYACGEPKQFCDTHAKQTPKEIIAFFRVA